MSAAAPWRCCFFICNCVVTLQLALTHVPSRGVRVVGLKLTPALAAPPCNEMQNFFLVQVEQHKGRLKMVDWGVANMTLEEVFIKISRQIGASSNE